MMFVVFCFLSVCLCVFHKSLDVFDLNVLLKIFPVYGALVKVSQRFVSSSRSVHTKALKCPQTVFRLIISGGLCVVFINEKSQAITNF